MKRFSAFLFLLLAVASSSLAQVQKIDSLKSLLDKSKEDTLKVNVLLDLSKRLYSSYPNEAMQYGNQAKLLADQLGFKKGAAYAFKNIGLAYYSQSKYVETLENWEQSLNIFKSIGDKLGECNLMNNIGAVYMNQGYDDKAIEYFLQSLKVSEQLGDKYRIATVMINIGALYFNKPATHDKALQYNIKAVKFSEESGDLDAIGTSSLNLGEVYFSKGDNQLALVNFEKALVALRKSGGNVPAALNYIGKVYSRQGNFEMAIKNQTDAFQLAQKTDTKLEMALALLGLAETYKSKGDIPYAQSNYHKALALAKEIGAKKELKEAYEGLAFSYSKVADYKNSFKYQQLLTAIKDTLYNTESDRRISGLQLNFDVEKKQQQIDLLTKTNELHQLDIEKQKFFKNALFVGFILIGMIAFILYRNNQNKVKANRILTQRNEEISMQKEEIATQRDYVDKQKGEIENLLLNILPVETAQELQKNGVATPRYYESVSVMFTDFKDFTVLAGNLSPQELVAELNSTFCAFDDIIEKFNLEKIKTVGDAYMCAGGIPTVDQSHFVNALKAGLAICDYMAKENEARIKRGALPWYVRVGIHTGPVVAGVVGKKKFAYDIWGDTVNIASRMETNGEPGKVNISAATYTLVKEYYDCLYRGKISAKNIGDVDMYFVERRKTMEVQPSVTV